MEPTKHPMVWSDFKRLWLRMAWDKAWGVFSRARGWNEAVRAVVTLLFATIAAYGGAEAIKSKEFYVSALWWFAIIPFGTLVVSFFWNLPKSPYEIYLELEKKRLDDLGSEKTKSDTIVKQLEKASSQIADLTTPRFTTSCNEKITGCIAMDDTRKYRYLRIAVETDSKLGIRNCVGRFKQLEKNGYVVFDHETPDLPFVPSGADDSLAKTIHYGTRYFLDVFIIATGNYPQIGIARKGLPIWNNDRSMALCNTNTKGDYIVTIYICGDGVPPVECKIRLGWTGASIPEKWEKIE
jgi:hypothetical protein